MADHTMISELVSEEMNTIEPQETVRTAHRRMESQTLRSLIVVEGDKAVGVIKWRDLRNADTSGPVSQYMKTDFPVLRRDMHVQDARGQLGDVDFDQIPVIDAEGRLVGEVPRGALVAHESATTGEAHIGRDDAPVVEGVDGPAYDLHSGMNVVNAERDKLGKITEITTDPATHRASHVLVQHGLLRKKHKRIPIDTIQRVDGDEVVLAISRIEFNFLADIEDEVD